MADAVVDINWPTVIAVLVAVIGGGAGLAALSRSGADQSKTFSESAQIVVDLMKQQTIDLSKRLAVQEAKDRLREERLSIIESELSAVQHWGERVLDVLDRAISLIPTPQQTEFMAQAEALRKQKPSPKGYADHMAPKPREAAPEE